MPKVHRITYYALASAMEEYATGNLTRALCFQVNPPMPSAFQKLRKNVKQCVLVRSRVMFVSCKTSFLYLPFWNDCGKKAGAEWFGLNWTEDCVVLCLAIMLRT